MATALFLGPYTASGFVRISAFTSFADWIDFDTITKLSHHASSVLAAIILFGSVGYLMRWLLHEGPIKRAVLLLDEAVLFALLAFFAYRLFLYL